MNIVYMILLFVLGLVCCTLGFRLSKAAAILFGALMFAGISFSIASSVSIPLIWTLLLMILAAILGGFLSCILSKVQGFIVGFFYGLIILLAGRYLFSGHDLSHCMSQLKMDYDLYILLACVYGVVMGIIALQFFQPTMILVSSLTGAFLITEGLSSFLQFQTILYYGILALITLIGVLIQILTTGEYRKNY